MHIKNRCLTRRIQMLLETDHGSAQIDSECQTPRRGNRDEVMKVRGSHFMRTRKPDCELVNSRDLTASPWNAADGENKPVSRPKRPTHEEVERSLQSAIRNPKAKARWERGISRSESFARRIDLAFDDTLPQMYEPFMEPVLGVRILSTKMEQHIPVLVGVIDRCSGQILHVRIHWVRSIVITSDARLSPSFDESPATPVHQHCELALGLVVPRPMPEESRRALAANGRADTIAACENKLPDWLARAARKRKSDSRGTTLFCLSSGLPIGFHTDTMMATPENTLQHVLRSRVKLRRAPTALHAGTPAQPLMTAHRKRRRVATLTGRP